MDGLNRLEEMLCDELSEMGMKGSLNSSTLEKVDTMAHALKNIQKIIMYEEYSGEYSGDEGYSGEEGYSGRRSYRRRSYDGGSYDSRSYARGRDSRGRYTSRASSPDEMRKELRRMASNAPNSQIKQDIENLIESLDR